MKLENKQELNQEIRLDLMFRKLELMGVVKVIEKDRRSVVGR